MIGDKQTYFTRQNCTRPFVILNGMVRDTMCSELLTLSEIRLELHRHLRANGFDAVFFYDPRKVLTMYDMQSSFVYRNRRLPTDAERKRFSTDSRATQQARTPEASEPQNLDEMPVLDDFVVEEAAPDANLPDRIYLPLRTNSQASMDAIRQNLQGVMTAEDVRCALVYYNLEQWKSAMNQGDLELLAELDRMRESRRSIAIFLAPSEPGQDIRQLLIEGGANANWSNFAGQYLLPGLERREDTMDSDLRLITLGAPGKGEIRNYLSMLRLRRENALRIDLRHLDDICTELAAKCSEKYISLHNLNQRMEEWILRHPDDTFAIESINEVIGGGRYRTARQELADTVGLDNLSTFFEEKANQQQMEGQMDTDGDDVTRLTPRQPHRRPSDFDLNMLLMGNPGTGKSRSVELIGKLFRELKLLPRGHSRSLQVGTMMNPNFRMDEEFRMALGGVLVIDEAYGLMDQYGGERILNDLTDCMSRYAGQLSVVLAGYKDRLLELLSVNPGLNSRFPESGRIEFPAYEPDTLRQIFLKMAENRPGRPVRISDGLARVLPDLFTNWVQSNMHKADWGNARAAANLLTTMVSLCSSRYVREGRISQVSEYVLTEDDLPEDMQEMTRPRAGKLDQALEILDKEIVGMANVKKFLMNIVNDVRLHGAGNTPPGAYLFLGPPGTGKSMMSEQIGQLLYLLNVIKSPHTVVRTAKDLVNPPPKRERPGQPSNPHRSGLREAVEEARGGVLFIDEAHQLASSSTTNGVQSGAGILQDLVPIMEDPEFRASTCLILAGYTGPMEEMLKMDQGFASRFPPKNRIRFTNYSAEELVEIMKSFSEKRGEILEKGFIDRTLAALSRYLPDVGPNFGNGRWIRNEYLPHARAKRDKRLLDSLHLKPFEAPTDEQLASIPPAARITLTAEDIPDAEGLSALAGPIGVAPPPPLTPETMLDSLYEKDQLVAFARSKIDPQAGAGFLDTASSSGINFTLSGPTGSGRRTAIRAIAEVFAKYGLIDSKEVHYFSRGNLVAGYVGQTPGQTRAAVSNAQGGVAVIMNPSDLFRDSSSGQDFGPEAVQELGNCISDYSANTCFVLVDSKEGLERFFRAAPAYRRSFQNNFELKDLSIEAMQKIFDEKVLHNFVFEESIRGLMQRDFVANWVTDRGGLGADFQNWNNGAEVDTLINKLREAWTNTPESERQETVEDGYPVRVITAEMFGKDKRKYLKETSLQEQSALDSLNGMVGWDRVKAAIHLIRTKLSTASSPEDVIPGNYLFIGNPGTGKTEAAKLMGSLLRATHALKQGYVITRTAGEMMDQLEEFDKILEMARNNVLFIDEAHQLGDYTNPRGRAVMKRLLTVLEDPDVKKDTCIILAGYPREMARLLEVDPGLRSRFDLEESRVFFDDYTAEELTQIMRNMAAKADRMREIGARAPLDMDRSPDFVQRAARVFQAVTAEGDPDYGNARFVRNFLHNSVNRQILRLAARYGDAPGAIPAEEYALLVADDIPERESRLIRDTEQRKDCHLTADQLRATEEGTVSITPENTSALKAELGHSVMLLEVTRDGRVAGYGTGFVITEDGHLLTCAHVVRNADSVRARMYWPGMPGGPVFWFDCEILQPVRENIDMAVVHITNGSGFIPLNLRDVDHPVGDAEETMVLGYPFGEELNPDLTKLVHNHFNGHVSSIQNAGDDNERCYQSGEGKAGNSGSPVFSLMDGRVVGVFDGSKLQKGKNLTEEMNYFTSIRLFWKFFVEDGPAARS